jgi:hypothetical protein
MIDYNKNLEILHDHYKETFAYIRERERQRDSLFLIVIGLLGLLFLEVQYPNDIQTLLKTIKTPVTEINFSILPVSIITSITWTVLLIIILRHCQTSITIERQYKYLHKLEDVIGSYFRDVSIYNREGEAYLKNYPVFSYMVWIFYTLIFPLIIIFMQVLIICQEIRSDMISYHYVYDTIIAGVTVLLLALYRAPQLIEAIKKKISKNP